MATCSRCDTIMASAPGTKCPACGHVSNPVATRQAPAGPAHATAAAPAPRSPIAAPPGSIANPLERIAPGPLGKLALGLTLIMYAAATFLASLVAAALDDDVASVIQFLCFALALAGALLIGWGMRFPAKGMAVLAVIMLIPGLNFLATLIMVAVAMKPLKDAGYKIGFMSVKP